MKVSKGEFKSNVIYYLTIILVGVSYYLTGKFGLQLAHINPSATPIWAPTGIALASFLLLGYRIWPVIFIAAFFTNLTTAGTIATSLGIAFGNTLEGLVGAYFVNTFAHGRNTFLKSQDLFSFTLFAAFLSTTLSPSLGITSLILGGFATWENFFPIWFTWWMGDVAGALIIAPFIIFWSTKRSIMWNWNKTIEAVILFVILFFGGIFLFIGSRSSYPLEFLSIPFMVWVAFRFGRRETITAILLLAGLAICGTLLGYGPFIRASQNESLLVLQAFLSVISLTAISLSVAAAEKREAQRTLRDREERFRALIEKNVDAICLTDSSGNITYVSPGFSRVLGYSTEEAIGKSGTTFINPADLKYVTEMTSQIINHPNKSVTLVTRCNHKDGSVRRLEITVTNLLNNPSVESIVSNFHDVTERLEAEQKIAQEKAEDDALLASIGDGIIATDQKGIVILTNKACEELLGRSKKDFMGKHISASFVMEDERGAVIPEKDRPINMALATGKKITATHYLFRKDQSKFPAIVTATPVILNKKIIGAIKIFHDITREKELDQMKDEFISLASHELRTPMAAIKGYVSMIIKGDYGKYDTPLQRPLKNISLSTERQIHLINNLLDISRIQAGKIKFNITSFDIHDVIQEVVQSLASLAHQKKIKLVLITKTHSIVQADPEMTKQILNNIIGNALKFIQKGSIIITYRFKNGIIYISVKDTGVGISPEDQRKLFGRFQQISHDTIDALPGSGLGLYISRKLAQKMGGDVLLSSSSEDKGSTFVLTLPLAHSIKAKKSGGKEVSMTTEKKRFEFWDQLNYDRERNYAHSPCYR